MSESERGFPDRIAVTDGGPYRALLIGTEAPNDSTEWTLADSLAELSQLATTAGAVVTGTVTQRLRSAHPATLFGKGKVEEIAAMRDDPGYDAVISDDDLSPTQQRNLEEALHVPVIDRSGLILRIFAQRAQSHEGRLQVELARLEYELPRFTGQWTHLERQAGATSTRGGMGETQLEVDRRRARKRVSELKVELGKVRNHRELYRKRRELAGLPIVAIVGYTNAGKSTLLNTLTRAGVLAEDKLFATLDPTSRRIALPSGQEALLTDTVGFIQKLPPTLVAAFRATLEELETADVLLHVLDVTHRLGYEQGESVLRVLDELGLKDKPVVTALNKIDLLADGRTVADPDDLPIDKRAMLDELARRYPDAVAVSAIRRWGLVDLRVAIESVLARKWARITVKLPYQCDELISTFRKRARVDDESYTDSGVVLTGHVPQRYLTAFEPYLV
jgi:GTPase